MASSRDHASSKKKQQECRSGSFGSKGRAFWVMEIRWDATVLFLTDLQLCYELEPPGHSDVGGFLRPS